MFHMASSCNSSGYSLYAIGVIIQLSGHRSLPLTRPLSVSNQHGFGYWAVALLENPKIPNGAGLLQ